SREDIYDRARCSTVEVERRGVTWSIGALGRKIATKVRMPKCWRRKYMELASCCIFCCFRSGIEHRSTNKIGGSFVRGLQVSAPPSSKRKYRPGNSAPALDLRPV